MKILLSTLNAKYIHLNLAIRILYDLTQDDFQIDWCEFVIKEDFEKIAKHCAQYDLIAFSCYIWNITQILEVCKLINEINPQSKILLGGPEVSYEFIDIIELDYIDFIISGEGEIPFVEFLKNYPNVASVPNLVYKYHNKEIIHNVQNVQFDVLHFEERNPYKYDNEQDINNKICYIETSRGCPYKCEFCLASLDNKVRMLPMDTIKSNLLYLMEKGRVVKFLDRTFNMKKDTTLEIFQFILENYKEKNVFQFEITADILHPDIISFVQTKIPKGLFRFEIGIQSVNKEVNLSVSRKQNFEKTTDIIKQVQDYVELHLDLIVGLPFEYFDDVKYSFESVFKLYAPELQLGFLKFLKGTPMRSKTAEHGYIYDEKSPYQIIESKYLSQAELQDISYVEHALEIYWNLKRAKNTLKYITENYSIFDFLLGLGKSFVSQFDNKHYTLHDIFEILYQYISDHFSEDKILLQMLSIDFCMYFKVRPKDFIFLQENKKTLFPKLENLGFDIHKNRYKVLPLTFDFEIWKNTNSIYPSNEEMVFEYTGIQLPKIYSFQIN